MTKSQGINVPKVARIGSRAYRSLTTRHERLAVRYRELRTRVLLLEDRFSMLEESVWPIPGVEDPEQDPGLRRIGLSSNDRAILEEAKQIIAYNKGRADRQYSLNAFTDIDHEEQS